MAPKKSCKRKEESTAERGKRKLIIDESESSFEDSHIPKGFTTICSEKGVESQRKKSLRPCAIRPEDMITPGVGETMERSSMKDQIPTETGYGVNQSDMPPQNTQGTEKNDHGVSPNSSKEKSLNYYQQALSDSFSININNDSMNVQPCVEDQGKTYSITLTEMANALPNTRKQGTRSISLTEMAREAEHSSDQEKVEFPTLATVGGCRVKEEFASTARLIENKHGNIIAGCLFKGILRCNVIEIACALYQKLEKGKFSSIAVAELENMKKDVQDLLEANVDVSWLAKRLDEIHISKGIYLAVPRMKELRNEKKERICELQKNVDEFKTKLQKAEKKVEEIKSKLQEEEKKVEEIKSELQEEEMELESEKEEAAKIRQEHILAKSKINRFYKKSLIEGI